ncbi:ArsC family reductase [Sphingopyxis sp. 113P3]|uniref:ArsC family reductase n=1 Tax=Sphingopyxis sp. (strain 113P3) TaxID=292913 RepID=UPI0006AD56C8|nr:ArsC family reductase [Sphingopyxis sp. 113P3]ALC13473.1 ArsC family transcriptional regulator [Sphingopyxis sp. 113P3]
MALTLYGISNCDTVKKARRWLDGAGISYRFHDFRKDGLEPARLQQWIDAVGWERLLNKSGTTFRKLPDADKAGLDPAKAKVLMLDQPAMIRRPVVEADDGISVGFSESDWRVRFAA